MGKRDNNIKDKKAMMTVNQIISIVLIVVGFGILLIFLVRIDWGQSTDRSVCHESVILRATIPDALSSYAPLRCKTIKYCISDKNIFQGKADCSKDFGNIKDFTTVKVKTTNDIEQFYAQEILECWSMMGEGKVSLFTEGVTLIEKKAYPSCVICSRIAFDKNLDNDLLKQIDLPLYLSTHKAPGKEYTYAQYLQGESNLIGIGDNLGGKSSLDQAIEKLRDSEKKTISIGEEDVEIGVLKEDDSVEELREENAILFMQINALKPKEVFTKDLQNTGLAFGGSFAFSPKATAAFIGKTITSKIAWFLAAGFLTYEQGMVAYNRAIAAGYCSDALTGPEARGGCSVVRTTDYNVKGISSYCENIESIM